MAPHVQVQLQPGDDGPVVVKTARTDEGRARLASEGERLGRAGHPGVVELVRRSEGELVLAWAGGETLELRRPPVTVAAGILAAVAATVADLHEVGIVHGRLDPSHVVLDGDGRPRLCGLRGPAAGEPRPLPADDVLALGEVIDLVVGGEVEVEPIPERRWGTRRWSGYQRRALLGVADRATHEDPARRPTARALAAAIAAAVPEARLAPGRHVPTSTPRPVPSPDPLPTRPPGEPVRAVDHARPVVPGPGPTTAAIGRSPGAEVGPSGSGSTAPATAPGAGEPAGRPVDETSPSAAEPVRRADGHGPDHDAGGGPAVGGPAVGGNPSDGASSPSGDEAADLSAPPRRLGWRRGAAVAAVAGSASLLAGWQLTGSPGPGDRVAGRASTVATPSTPGSTPRGDPCPHDGRTAPAGPPMDVDGDRCADDVEVAGTEIRTAGRTFSVGRAGDRVAVRDWDCDGTATPGVVRPETGEVFLFGAWATEAEAVTVHPAAVVPRARSFAPGAAADGDRRCPAPAVVLTDGTVREVPAGATGEPPR